MNKSKSYILALGIILASGVLAADEPGESVNAGFIEVNTAVIDGLRGKAKSQGPLLGRLQRTMSQLQSRVETSEAELAQALALVDDRSGNGNIHGEAGRIGMAAKDSITGLRQDLTASKREIDRLLADNTARIEQLSGLMRGLKKRKGRSIIPLILKITAIEVAIMANTNRLNVLLLESNDIEEGIAELEARLNELAGRLARSRWRVEAHPEVLSGELEMSDELAANRNALADLHHFSVEYDRFVNLDVNHDPERCLRFLGPQQGVANIALYLYEGTGTDNLVATSFGDGACTYGAAIRMELPAGDYTLEVTTVPTLDEIEEWTIDGVVYFLVGTYKVFIYGPV